jgi:hypothetical protein
MLCSANTYRFLFMFFCFSVRHLTSHLLLSYVNLCYDVLRQVLFGVLFQIQVMTEDQSSLGYDATPSGR